MILRLGSVAVPGAVLTNHDMPSYADPDAWAEYNMRFFADDDRPEGDKDAIDQETLDHYVSFA